MDIRTTKNYGKFEYLGFNRQVDKNHVQRIVESIDTHGFWPEKAITCFKDSP